MSEPYRIEDDKDLFEVAHKIFDELKDRFEGPADFGAVLAVMMIAIHRSYARGAASREQFLEFMGKTWEHVVGTENSPDAPQAFH